MCGRFTLTVDPAQVQDTFNNYTFPEKFAPRFNIAPTQPVLAIPNDDKFAADFFVWGLIPMWAKDPNIGNRLIKRVQKPCQKNRRFAAVLNINDALSWQMDSMSGKLLRARNLKHRFLFI